MSNHLRILTVEDEAAVAQLLALVLGGPTSKVTHVCNGEEALAKIAADPKPFDVVITDHNMPKMTGLQLVGKPFDEATVLRVSRAYERVTPWRDRRPLL